MTVSRFLWTFGVGLVLVSGQAWAITTTVENRGDGIWVTGETGARTHAVTGFVCPAGLSGGWQLTSTTEFGRAWDVACNYDSSAGRVTLHAYTPDNSQNDEVRGTSRPIIQRAGQGARLNQMAVTLNVAGETWNGVRVEARPAGGPVSAVSVFDSHGWRVKVRETTTSPDVVTALAAEFYGQQTALARQIVNCQAWEAASGRESRLVTGEDAMSQGMIDAMAEVMIVAQIEAPEPTDEAPAVDLPPVPEVANACTVMVVGTANDKPVFVRGYSGPTVIRVATDGPDPLLLGSVRVGMNLESGQTNRFVLVTRELPATTTVHRVYRQRPSNEQALEDMLLALTGRLAGVVSISPSNDGEPVITIVAPE
jgi:hypothetical protein